MMLPIAHQLWGLDSQLFDRVAPLLAEPRGMLELGVEHILLGPDHLLFVLGLLLLVRRLRPLIWTLTAFTIGHSLSLVGVVAGVPLLVPSAAIEAVIALSIVFLARELLVGASDSLTRRRPMLVAGGFGLLHGVGFGGALLEIGLPAGEALLPLLLFNLGVELGQVVFVAAVLVLIELGRRVPASPVLARRVAAYAMGAVAMAWTIERLMTAWGGGM